MFLSTLSRYENPTLIKAYDPGIQREWALLITLEQQTMFQGEVLNQRDALYRAYDGILEDPSICTIG